MHSLRYEIMVRALNSAGRIFIPVIIAILSVSMLILVILAYVGKDAYMWSTLYLGSAIVSAFSALVTIPFAIWVLYMQTRYGSMIVRLFLNKIMYPFTILILTISLTAIAMILAFSEFYVPAYLILIIESAVFIPLIAFYILKLMTLNPMEVVNTIISSSKDLNEVISALLKLATTYISETPIEERAIATTLRRIQMILLKDRNYEREPPQPTTWHAFRSFLSTLMKENVPLPSRKPLGSLMKVFLIWLLIHGKDRAARMLMRYYRRVALRYLEVRLPSEVLEDLILNPMIEPIIKMKVKEELKLYAYAQLMIFLRTVRAMALRGDVVPKEVCNCIKLIDPYILPEDVEKFEYLKSLAEFLNRLRYENRCVRTSERAPPYQTITSASSSEPQKEDSFHTSSTSVGVEDSALHKF